MHCFKKIHYLLIAISLILTLHAGAPKEADPVTSEQTENKSEGKDFIRFNESKTSASLETASAKYTHNDGITVELIGVVHIADKDYYKKFN